MRTGKIKTALALCALMAATGAAAQSTTDIQVPPAGFDTGMIEGPQIYRPMGQPRGVVFLISDAQGWGAADEAEAKALTSRGMAVVGLDLPSYLKGLEKHPDDDTCAYAIADIEELSKRLQAGGEGDYHLPLIAGRGDGGGLALAFAAQTPASTIEATVVADPSAAIALAAPLCTDAQHETTGGRTTYGLTAGELNDPVDVVLTPTAPQAAQDHVAALARDYPDITVTSSTDAPADALAAALSARLDAIEKAEGPLNLPITEMAVPKPAQDTMAIIYSGDGGWRDIDREVGATLQKAGVPVIGVDSLRYFWNARKPQDTADDLSRIIRHYQTEWGVKHVLLIGYSFGADILPVSYSLLPTRDQAAVSQMTLMALSHERDDAIHVTGWLGMSSGSANDPTKDLQKVPANIVQCIYGEGDDDDACHELTDRGYEMVGLTGGHHFDGDYQALAGHILAGLKTRL
ncbi:virulence factor family protein [Sinirhodobacter populi]|uniref:Virulence factor family protein n=1 Tax=Paenirhodobacter populi TaxID=2306993 RepID=A0A443KFD8_9RHOB|nr:AcvB/VirJ family lysyl-phosphatidylglycerol hydrolase [Sinirhodobacter populi]RWR31468.1 virulence factor family protein [Sinirhodobacter populi]